MYGFWRNHSDFEIRRPEINIFPKSAASSNADQPAVVERYAALSGVLTSSAADIFGVKQRYQ